MAQALPLPPHRTRFPSPTGRFQTLPEEDQQFMHELVAALQRELDPRRTATQALTHFMLLDSSGAAWKVTVSTAGVLSAVPFATGGAVA